MEKSKSINLRNQMDTLAALGVIGIVLIIIIPLPDFMLDILIALNLTLAITILLLTMFTTNVLQFSSFPSLLLITTLFRLGLNISSTRLILNEARAGNIIDTFGSFVVGDNYIVGVIIFAIIVIIQFVVITNGAGRVSEVTARFTLDAMPGKQMSIDADLNAGLIDDKQAKERRERLQQEADFYGAMDGASKFVKGDAIAGIIITLINIIAGIIMGCVTMGLTMGDSAQLFVKLTVGDGLVSQIPALLISVASGILVTRTGNDDNFGNTLTAQLTGFPKVLAIASAVLMFLFFIPGMPKMIMATFAIGCGVCSYFLYKDETIKVQEEIEAKEVEVKETESREPENVTTLVQVEPLEIEIGYGLIPLADENLGGDLLQRIASVRRQCAIEIGIIVQPIRIRDNLQLDTNEYILKLRGTTLIRGEVMPNMILCMNPEDNQVNIKGIPTVEPTFGLPAVWIKNEDREEAELKGYTVVDPITVMVTHLTEVIKGHAHELLGRQETKIIIDAVQEKYPAVVEELVPDLMTLGEVQKVLQSLLKERIPVKDMVTILESLADNSRTTKDIETLTEYVRLALARTISNELVNPEGKISVVTLSPNIEGLIVNNTKKSVHGSFPVIDPATTKQIFTSLKDSMDRVYFHNNQPVVLVSPNVRVAFRKLIEMVFPHVSVISMNEIPNNVEISNEGVVELR